MFYKARENVIKMNDDYSSTTSEAKYKSIQGEQLKILTLIQMFQRLPIALAQVKAGKIIYSLYCAKKITKNI